MRGVAWVVRGEVCGTPDGHGLADQCRLARLGPQVRMLTPAAVQPGLEKDQPFFRRSASRFLAARLRESEVSFGESAACRDAGNHSASRCASWARPRPRELATIRALAGTASGSATVVVTRGVVS